MEFRLTYDGPLNSSQPDDDRNRNLSQTKRDHKHAIRKSFHPQLKRLWEITPFLKTGIGSGPLAMVTESSTLIRYDLDFLTAKHSKYGFNFVPLVTGDLDLSCSLDILFLRSDDWRVLHAGDIDNRIKTLFDALRIPVDNEKYSERTPNADEKPFFCLLEDDSLITKISVETDQLLQLPNSAVIATGSNRSEVRLVITVRLRPREMTLDNMQFG